MTLECSPLLLDPRGRLGIGVDQSQGGTNYPFVDPSSDVENLLADLHVSYDDPHPLPLRVRYLFGLGCIHNSVPVGDGYADSYRHPVEIIIADADGQLVFDSREAGQLTPPVLRLHSGPYFRLHQTPPTELLQMRTGDVFNDYGFFARPWGPRNHIYEWHTDRGVCRIITHTRWNPTLQPEPRDYNRHILPGNGTLDERAVYQIPRRVKSFRIVFDKLSNSDVEFHPGYNMELLSVTDPVKQGGRHATSITLNATGGAGLGIYPGCLPEPLAIKRINGIGPTPQGHFQMAATDCYFIRQPTTVISDEPRITYPSVQLFPANVPATDLPDPAAGTTINARGWPESLPFAHLQFGNDCGPCCQCGEFVAIANYNNDVFTAYQGLAHKAVEIRAAYEDARKRYLAVQACATQRPLRVFLQPQICPYLDVGVQFCNQTAVCKTNVVVAVTISGTDSSIPLAVVVPGYGRITGASNKPSYMGTLTERYEPGGSFPTFTAHWDSVNPHSTVTMRFRLRFPSCSTAATVTATVTGQIAGNALNIDGTELPAFASDTQALRCPASAGDVLTHTGCT